MTDQNAGTAEEISIRGRSRRRGSVKPEQGHTEKHTEKIEREERTRRQTKRGKHAEPESSGSESAKMTAQILNPEWSEEEESAGRCGLEVAEEEVRMRKLATVWKTAIQAQIIRVRMDRHARA